MYARSRGEGPLRPSGLPEVTARRRALLRRAADRTADRAADRAALRANTEDLRRIDMMIAVNEDKAQSPRSAVAWTVAVLAVAGLLTAAGYLLSTVPVSGFLHLMLQVVAALLLTGTVVSASVSLLYLWAGVVLHRRCVLEDRLFRSEVGGMVSGYSPDSPTAGLSRACLVDQLEALTALTTLNPNLHTDLHTDMRTDRDRTTPGPTSEE